MGANRADASEPRESRAIRLGDLAERLGLALRGDAELVLRGVAALDQAQSDQLSFVRSAKIAEQFARSEAGAVILPVDLDPGDRSALLSLNPAFDFARAVALLQPPEAPSEGIAPDASVAASAEIHPSASIGPGATVGARCRVGADTILHAGTTLYHDVAIGTGCELHARAVVREGSILGDRVILQPGVVIGGDGFGYVPDEAGRPHKMPHVGRVVIEDDVEIGANSTVDRATLGETRIRRGVKIDNLVQVAHNCDIGEDVLVAAQSGFSGSTEVARGAIVMAQVGAAGHLRIGEGAFVGARAGLHKDVPDGARVWGAPQMEERRWHRSMAALGRLPDVLKRLRAVESRLGLRESSATSSKPSAAPDPNDD